MTSAQDLTIEESGADDRRGVQPPQSAELGGLQGLQFQASPETLPGAVRFTTVLTMAAVCMGCAAPRAGLTPADGASARKAAPPEPFANPASSSFACATASVSTRAPVAHPDEPS